MRLKNTFLVFCLIIQPFLADLQAKTNPLVPRSGDCIRIGENQPGEVGHGLSATIDVVDWDNDGGRDILYMPNNNYIGRGLYLYKENQTQNNQIPRYHAPVLISRTDITGSHPVILPEPDKPHLLVYGDPIWNKKENETHPGELKLYPNLNRYPPLFANKPQIIDVQGKSLLEWLKGSPFINPVQNPETGKTELITYVRTNSRYWPDGRSPWTSEPLKYAGPGKEPGDLGKGYNENGNWRGGGIDFRISRLVNQGTANHPVFSKPQLLYKGEVFPVGYTATLVDMDMDGERDLLINERVFHLVYIPGKNGQFTGDRIELDCSPLKGYYAHSMIPFDIDNDGIQEVLLAGNAGVVWWIDYKNGQWHERKPFKYKGGAFVRGETLAVPCFSDIDHDNDPDLLLGDSSGFLWFYENASQKPFQYTFLSGQRLKADDEEICHKPGENGSIQGPSEACWGYLNPLTVDWDEDGRIDVITNDSKADYMWYRNKSKDGIDLAKPVQLQLKSNPFHGAWRSRPALWDHNTLVVLNWERQLQFFHRDANDPVQLKTGDHLKYEDGEIIIGCGINGYWGRSVFCAADWNHDGKQDIVIGTHFHLVKVFENNFPSRATAFWLENTGSNENPVFKRAKLIRKKDGSIIDMDVHKCAVWVQDFKGDGTPDLAIGAEDGRVRVWYCEDLQ
jgi:hypothetical protein